MPAPIDLYYWPTPNGWKISIAIEEMGLPYRCHPIDIGAGDQHAPDYLKISPNNRIPAITDPEGLYGVLDRQLARSEFVAGDFYSIADMALWGWCSLWEGQQQTLEDKPHFARWLEAVGAREGVERGRALHADKRRDPTARK